MDFRDTPEEAAFRSGLRIWLEEHLPDDSRATAAAQLARRTRDARLEPRLCDAGYVGLTWPEEYGGGGAPLPTRRSSSRRSPGPRRRRTSACIGLGMAGPTIIARGTDEQKARYLAPLLSAEEIWCQGFSEPGAGSDLAGVRTTRAVRDGDDCVVNGQKVWSSLRAHRRLVHPARPHRPGRDQHAGLTYLLVDMHAPGRRGAAAAADHRRRRSSTRSSSPTCAFRREPPRRARWRLAGRDDDAAARARHPRLRAAPPRSRCRSASSSRSPATAAPTHARARPDRARVDRAAGAALHELPLAHGAR